MCRDLEHTPGLRGCRNAPRLLEISLPLLSREKKTPVLFVVINGAKVCAWLSAGRTEWGGGQDHGAGSSMHSRPSAVCLLPWEIPERNEPRDHSKGKAPGPSGACREGQKLPYKSIPKRRGGCGMLQTCPPFKASAEDSQQNSINKT